MRSTLRRSGMRLGLIVAVAFAALVQGWLPDGFRPGSEVTQQRTTADLPPEAIETLELILRGGPFPYRKDGSTFHNRERLLPDKPRGYYREYTVPTPGARDRGARRFVTGGKPPEVFYYTEDHYRSFRRIDPPLPTGTRTSSAREAAQVE
ncbi:MAG TPA: ribonuclease domain-containing protein [Rhodocyclaceae bacterium]|nr:ribonuclease domain-containing protein [Rhodocyclaceae bacterium]